MLATLLWIWSLYGSLIQYSIGISIVYYFITRNEKKEEDTEKDQEDQEYKEKEMRPSLQKGLLQDEEIDKMPLLQNNLSFSQKPSSLQQRKTPMKETSSEEDSVTWQAMHSSMMNKYTSKFPNKKKEKDEYDDEIKSLFNEYSLKTKSF